MPVSPESSSNLDLSDKPLVSVTIIFLNAERFIEEAIESVLRQTYANWELLLVDDGSTDGSTEIARSYTEHGLAREELRQEELDTKDPDYEVLITARAVKRATVG